MTDGLKLFDEERFLPSFFDEDPTLDWGEAISVILIIFANRLIYRGMQSVIDDTRSFLAIDAAESGDVSDIEDGEEGFRLPSKHHVAVVLL